MASLNRAGVISTTAWRPARCWRKRWRIDDALVEVSGGPFRRRATADVTSTVVMRAMQMVVDGLWRVMPRT